MLTIKKRGLDFKVLWVIAAASVLLTGCEPPGTRALHKGEKLLNAGKYPEAVAKFDEATRLLGDSAPSVQAQAWDWLGVALQYAGQPREALAAYTQALKLDRNMAPAAYNMGCLYLDYGNYRAAIDQFTTCLALPRGPEIKDADIYLKIGLSYLRLADQTPGANRARYFEAARSYLDAVHQRVPGPEEQNALGLVFLKRSRAATEALARFKEALRLDPTYTPALLNIAIVHHQYLNDPQMALQEYRAYLAAPESPQQPKPVPAKDVEVIVQNLERQLSPAPAPVQPQPVATNKPVVTNSAPPVKSAPAKPETNAIKTAVPPKVSSSSTGSEVTKIPTPSKEPAQDEKPAKRPSTNSGGVASSTNSPAPVTNTPGVTHIPEPAKSVAPQNRYRYLAAATMLVAGNHDEAARLVSQGFAAQQNDKKGEAMVCFQRAIKADPRCYDAYYLLGGVARESGNLPVALDALERAVSLKPESADPRYAFAWTLSKAKFPQDCADELEKLLKQTPNEVRAHLLLANVYAQELGMTHQAREHYQRVIDLEPNHPQASSIRNWLKATEGI